MSDYALRLYTRPDHYAGKTWEGWYCGLGHHGGSDCLDNTNFEAFLRDVRAASDDLSILEPGLRNVWSNDKDDAMHISSVYVVYEKHWAVGWVEWVAIHPSDLGAMKKAAELMESLNSYPVLDEDLWSERETAEIEKYWQEMSLAHRVDTCREAGDSIFAARHNYPLEKTFYWMRDTWN